MRRWLFLVFSMLLLVVGCQRRSRMETLSEAMPVFAEVYALKDHQSDSAARLMQSVVSTIDEAALQRRSPFLFNEYQLLKTELFRGSRGSIVGDSVVLRTFAFYDSIVSESRKAQRDKTLLYHFARSLYFKAAVESRREQYANAYSDYLRALGVMDGLIGERQAFRFRKRNDTYEHFTGRIYDRLAWFLYNNDEWEAAMECIEMASECYGREGDQQGLASNFDLMGDIMLAQDDRVSSARYYRSADSIYAMLKKSNSYLNFRRLLRQGIESAAVGDIEGAKAALQQALKDNPQSWMARRIHFGMGYVYNDLHELDSALYHYERAYPLLPLQTVKAYGNIITLSNALGDSLKAARYGQLLAELSLQRFRQSAENAKMVKQFEQYKEERDVVAGRNLFYYIVGFIVLLAVAVIIDTVVIHRRRRRHLADREQHERIKTSLEEQIEQGRAEAMQKEEKISALQLKLEQAISNPSFQSLPFNEKMDVLMQMPICQRVLKVHEINVKASLNYPELALSEIQKSRFVSAVDAVFPKFSVKIIESYPSLKRSDVIYCCFYILGVNDREAAALMGKTYQAVWKRSSKLYEIFGDKGDLQFVLHDIIKNW